MNVTTAIALLQAARGLIDRIEEDFICWALDDALARIDGPDLLSTHDHLKTHILNQLDGWGFLQSWVNSQSYRGDRWYSHYGLHRLCRLAWIDAMIRDLKATGELP